MADPTYDLTDHDLSLALHDVGEPSHGGVPSLPQARSLLETVLTAAADDLEEYLDRVRSGQLRFVADQPETFVFADPSQTALAELLQDIEEYTSLNEAIIRSIMIALADEMTTREWDSVDPIVVPKPADWQRGEDGVERLFRWLLAVGLSPAEAMDFWATVLRGTEQSAWAETRGVDTETVTANVTAARAALSGE